MGLVSSGSGSGVGPSCALQRNANVDVHAVAITNIAWDALVDNLWNLQALGAIPSGLGLTFAFDGSSAFITTTVAGTWAFTFGILNNSGTDAGIRGYIGTPFAQDPQPFGPLGTAQGVAAISGVYALPSGAASTFFIRTTTAATANPFNIHAQASIVRLA